MENFRVLFLFFYVFFFINTTVCYSLVNFLLTSKSKDTIVVKAKKNMYIGQLQVFSDIIICSTQKAKITTQFKGTILSVYFPYTIVKGFFFNDSGKNITLRDSCIFIGKFGNATHILLNKFLNCCFGIWSHNSNYNVFIRNYLDNSAFNTVVKSIRGNTIQIFNNKGTFILENYIRFGRDGIYITTSKEVVIKKNILISTRYGIHYMYSNACSLILNKSNNSSVGFAIMYSKFLDIFDNYVMENKEHGILLRDVYYSKVYLNKSFRNYEGIFFGSSYFNKLKNNYILRNFIAIKISNGIVENKVWKNNFIDNKIQIQLTDNRIFIWSNEDIGNYWSHYVGFNKNSFYLIGKKFYSSLISDWLITVYPSTKIVFKNPVMMLFQQFENTFPSVRSSAIVDFFPLLLPW